VRHILEKLKTGGSVGILMDQNTSLQEGIYSDFFGLPAATSTGWRCWHCAPMPPSSPVISPLSRRPYTIKFLPPIEMLRTGDTNHDVAVNTRTLNKSWKESSGSSPRPGSGAQTLEKPARRLSNDLYSLTRMSFAPSLPDSTKGPKSRHRFHRFHRCKNL